MSRRKQTKPFKVEENELGERDDKPKLRKTESSLETQSSISAPNSDTYSVNGLEDNDTALRRSKRHMKCNKCGKTLASALSLARHKLTHSQKKPYQCPKCDSSFKTSSNMHRHLRIHFRGSNDVQEDEVKPLVPKVGNLRSSRQNKRTPNKFKEFDVHLIGMGLRSSLSPPATNARSYSKSKVSELSTVTQKIINGYGVDIGENSTALKRKNQQTSEDVYPDDLTLFHKDSNKEKQLCQTNKPHDPDLVCHVCNRSFISQFGLLTHTAQHSNKSTNRCNLCDQRFTTHKGLVMHNIIVHKMMFDKHEASSTVSEKENLDLVLTEFSSNKFALIAEVTYSLSKQRHPYNDSKHIFICKKCDTTFPLLQSLKLHVDKFHGCKKEKQNEAKNSPIESYLSKMGLSTRQKKECKSLKNPSASAICNGVDDDTIYTSPSVAVSNTPEWIRDIPELLSSSYKNESKILHVKHRSAFKIIRKKTPVPSRRKNYFGGTDNEVVEESTAHNVKGSMAVQPFSGERNVYWCRICNYSSHEKSALVRHLLTHSGIRPYFCKLCNYAFTTKANCERHVRKRHNCLERSQLDAAVRCDWEMLKKAPRDDIYMITGSNSSCPVCSKSFSCNNDLKEHLKVHEERQFVCQLCNVRCTTRNNCVRHILHKHPGIPYTEANDIITFAGTRNKELRIKKLSNMTFVKDKSEIDISKGSLLKRQSTKLSTNVLTSRRTSIHHSHWRAPSTHKVKTKKCTVMKINGESPEKITPADESLRGTGNKRNSEGCSVQNSTKAWKIPKLIPLMKIKAYNQAVLNSYENLVAMYQGLNIFNIAQNYGDGPKKAQEGNNSKLEGSQSTLFCKVCCSMFKTVDELHSHFDSCSRNRNDLEQDSFEAIDGDEMQEFSANKNYNDFNCNEEGDYISFAQDFNKDSLSMEGDAIDWEMRHASADEPGSRWAEEPTENEDSLAGFRDVEDWVESIVPHSPSSNKSSGTPTQSEISTSAPNDVPRVFAKSGKESSYVEDSLLMSMFNEPKTKDYDSEINESSLQDNLLDVSRYSMNLPTMVNMDNLGLIRKYKPGELLSSDMESDIEKEKVLVPSKGRFYTARKCPQCDKSFPWASSLRRHIMTHTGLKLYMCRLCKMRFTTRSNLIRHVYRRHGMAKQHPDFASCLAKLHPSDTLLREVEADVRRRVEVQKKTSPPPEEMKVDQDFPEDSVETDSVLQIRNRKRPIANDFQSMLEEDPETQLVDLDYSPRDDLPSLDNKKPKIKLVIKTQQKISPDVQGNEDSEADSTMIAEEEEVEQNKTEENFTVDEQDDITILVEKFDGQKEANKGEVISRANKEESEFPLLGGKNLRSRTTRRSFTEHSKNGERDESKTEKKNSSIYKTVIKPRIRNKQSTQFVCGLCKKIFKTVPDLVDHLDTHDVPHSWHCVICGVPFTNKYNCQRHLTRRHARSDIEPLYVEDSKHGPRTARGLPRKVPVTNEDGSLSSV